MVVQLNHTIVSVRDKHESATFLAEILGLDEPTPFGPFLIVQVDNDVSLDFAGDAGLARSTPTTEVEACTGRIRAGTSSRSSLVPTAAEAERDAARQGGARRRGPGSHDPPVRRAPASPTAAGCGSGTTARTYDEP